MWSPLVDCLLYGCARGEMAASHVPAPKTGACVVLCDGEVGAGALSHVVSASIMFSACLPDGRVFRWRVILV